VTAYDRGREGGAQARAGYRRAVGAPTAAATAIGIGEKTLRRWLAEPEFQADYGSARERAVKIAVGRLQGLLSKATDTLERTMTCGNPATEIRAAVAVIEHGFRGAELLDLAERIAMHVVDEARRRGDSRRAAPVSSPDAWPRAPVAGPRPIRHAAPRRESQRRA
jgi:hypothetical protein